MLYGGFLRRILKSFKMEDGRERGISMSYIVIAIRAMAPD